MKIENRAFRFRKQLVGSSKRRKHWARLFGFAALALLTVLLAGCGLFRRGQRVETPLAPAVGPNVAPTESGPLFGVQVVVQAGNAPTSLPDPAFLKSLNVTTTIAWVYYPEPGQNANGWINTEKQLAERLINGTGLQQIGVHIMPNPRPGTGAGPRFRMPADLNAYSAALTALAKALPPNVRYYSIGNEFSMNIWGGTIEDYATLLRVSGQAIKAGNPNALILDSGIASQNYVYPIAKMMVQQGNPNGALSFAKDFLPHATVQIPSNESELTSALATTQAQSEMSWFQALFTTLCAYYDVYQLHYYQSWSSLQTVYDWIHGQMQANKCVKPIQLWELGYPLNANTAINYQDQAQTVAKLVTISAGEGTQLINYFPLRTFDIFRGIATNDFQLLPPGIAFKTTTGKLIGVTQATRLSLGNNVWGYEFVKGAKKIYVAWSTANTTVKLPFQGGATVTDINGNATHTDSNEVAATTSPVFVEP